MTDRKIQLAHCVCGAIGQTGFTFKKDSGRVDGWALSTVTPTTQTIHTANKCTITSLEAAE
jgi:hypothetical protein